MPRIVEIQMLPDPSMTDAEYFHQRRTKPGPFVGKAPVAVNLIELVGGFARFEDRTEAQMAAAARYRLLWERSQIGGARAVDISAIRVDKSGPPEDIAFMIGEDARREYRAAVQCLGMIRSALVESVVVHDRPLRQIASGSRARARVGQELREALDDLAHHFARSRRGD